METIKPLDSICFDTLYSAFNVAFGSYEVQVSKDELQVMLKRRGFIPKLSFGAFVNDKLVSFTLNGIGMFNGKKTAYDTGTGTIEAFRGKGMASKIFTYSIPYLKDAGISQYLLEVLQHNESAVSVYKKLGFTVSREFNYFVQSNIDVNLHEKELRSSFSIKETGLDSTTENFMSFWDFAPSWQNSFEAIQRCIADFRVIGAYDGLRLIGYCIFEPNSGDLTQIAIDKAYRRQGIGTALLKEALFCNIHSSVKAVNSEINCAAMTAFLESNNIPLKGKQFEMTKTL